jgi:hypothetical protein
MVGFVLGVAILVGGATAVAYMLLSGMNSNPPKPVFTEEKKRKLRRKKPLNPSLLLPSQNNPKLR